MCDVCDAIKNGEGVLFKSSGIVALVDPSPVAKGHVIVTTEEHYPIIESVPDEIVRVLFQLVNKVSIILFEALQAQGTNIFVCNGINGGQDREHFVVNIIPRYEDDGLDFSWDTQQASQDVLNDMDSKLTPRINTLLEGGGEASKPAEEPQAVQSETTSPEPEIHEGAKPKETESKKPPDEVDYMIEHLRRMP